jgi:hypothetical protein
VPARHIAPEQHPDGQVLALHGGLWHPPAMQLRPVAHVPDAPQ